MNTNDPIALAREDLAAGHFQNAASKLMDLAPTPPLSLQEAAITVPAMLDLARSLAGMALEGGPASDVAPQAIFLGHYVIPNWGAYYLSRACRQKEGSGAEEAMASLGMALSSALHLSLALYSFHSGSDDSALRSLAGKKDRPHPFLDDSTEFTIGKEGVGSNLPGGKGGVICIAAPRTEDFVYDLYARPESADFIHLTYHGDMLEVDCSEDKKRLVSGAIGEHEDFCWYCQEIIDTQAENHWIIAPSGGTNAFRLHPDCLFVPHRFVQESYAPEPAGAADN